MRGADKNKNNFQKVTQTINFDKVVLEGLERRARETGSSVSSIVNSACRTMVLSDVEFYRQMSKEHYLKFQEYQFMKSQAEIQVTVR